MNTAATLDLLKKGGVSLPPILGTLLFLSTSILLYPHHTAKTNVKHVASNLSQTNLANAASIPSSKKSTTNTVFTPTITPAITSTVISRANMVTPPPTTQPSSPTPVPSQQQHLIQVTPTRNLTHEDTTHELSQLPREQENKTKTSTEAKPIESPLLDAAIIKLPKVHIKPVLSLPLISEK